MWITLCFSLLQQEVPESSAVLKVGEPVNGLIESSDAIVQTARLIKDYSNAPVRGKTFKVLVPETGHYFFELRSHFFNAYLVLRKEEAGGIAEDDDGLLRTHSRIEQDLVEGVRYSLDACALHGGTGEFVVILNQGIPKPYSTATRIELEVEDARNALEHVEGVRGSKHPDTASRLNDLAALLHDQGNYKEARPLYERALAIREEVLSHDHPDTATSLNSLAGILTFQGNYEEARPLLERALAIYEEVLGPKHPDTATSLNNLAWLLQFQGSYEEARPLLERALAISEEVLGPKHPDTATSLNNLASILQSQGNYEEARPLLERALAIYEEVLGSKHPDTATSLNNLAWLLQFQGSYEEARPLLERALAIWEEVLGPKHPNTGMSLNSLAWLLESQGNYEEAWPLYERALAIREEVLGPNHPDTGTSLNNLAGLFESQGNYEEARPLYERALAIREEVLGPQHPDTAASLNNLALLLHSQGNYEEARPLFERALAICEEVLGPNHPHTGTSLNNLAGLLESQGNYEEARPLVERALAISEEVLGPNHPHTGICLIHLARLPRSQGNYEEARPLYERALAICEEVLGAEHPHTATSLHNLWLLMELDERFQDAGRYAIRSLEVSRKILRRQLPVLSERERLLLAAMYRDRVDDLVSLAPKIEHAESRPGVYDEVLYWKGLVSRGLLEGRSSIRATTDTPEVLALLSDLHRVESMLSSLFFQESGEHPAAKLERLKSLRSKRDQLERELARKAPHVSLEPVPEKAAAIQSVLADTDVLLDFTYYRSSDSSLLLAAFVLRRNSPVDRVELGAADVIRKELQTHLFPVSRNRGVEPIKGVEAIETVASDRSLSDLLWKPLAAYLQGVERIFLCPDAELATLPFETLPEEEEGQFLIERYSFVYLQSALDLVRSSNSPPLGEGLLLAGDLDYDSALDSSAAPNSSSDSATNAKPSTADDVVAMEEEELRSLQRPFRRLTATREEVEELAFLFRRSKGAETPLDVLTSAEASEASIKEKVRGKRYVHLATHGFFAPEETKSTFDLSRELVDKEQAQPMQLVRSARPEERFGLLPGLLSGVVLSGANLARSHTTEDGILTAEEVSWLDLSGCELVTLSTCESGLGLPKSGEHLIGLRRALHLAGARATVTSLWRVNDEETRWLMSEFYRRLWNGGQTKSEALRGAQLALLERNCARFGDPLPGTWGAFVLEGDWR